MNARRVYQRGQGMVEYTVVTALGILVLLGPGTDMIRYTMRTIQDNYSGYSYAMSLSQWPEFDIRSADTIISPIAVINSGIGDVATQGSELPPRAVPASTALTDFDFNSYRNWLTSQGVSEDRATELAGPSLDAIFSNITSYFTGSIPGLEGLSSDLPPDIGDIVEDLLPFDFF
ncbi:MAG: hypothetical protein ACI9BW_003354 [Gammaproteobacteria bacterium]